MSDAAIQVTDLVKEFAYRGRSGRPPVRAMDGLSLTIAPGEVVAFLGPNGAGKTTILDIVLGYTRPTSGTARVLGRTPRQAAASGRIGAVLQSGGDLAGYTVTQALTSLADLHGMDRGQSASAISAVAASCTLDDLLARRITRLSGGERQRFRLAAALLNDPDLLVLDEPTTGIDVTSPAGF